MMKSTVITRLTDDNIEFHNKGYNIGQLMHFKEVKFWEFKAFDFLLIYYKNID